MKWAVFKISNSQKFCKKHVTTLLMPLFLFMSCSLSPVQREIILPAQEINTAGLAQNNVRIIMYNNACFWTHGLDRTGHINVTMNNKGVGRLDMKKYIVIDTPKGKTNFDLAHRDLLLFTSHHSVNLSQKLNYIEIKPTFSSQRLTIKPSLPEDFEDDFEKAITTPDN